MNPQIKYFQRKFEREMEDLAGLSFRSARYLIAVSGGNDSMALATLADASKLNYSIAHCNFGLRPESLNEQHSVTDYFNKMEVPVYSHSFDTEEYAANHQLSIQQAARHLRYSYFDELRREHGFDFLLTAHHADDNIETFFLHLGRGSGPKGLSGIPENKNQILRPLLSWTKDELVIWNKMHQIPICEDSSNASIKYDRNFLRHQVIGTINQRFPYFNKNVLKSMSILKQYDAYVSAKINALRQNAETRKPHGSIYDLNLIDEPELVPFFIRQVLEEHQFSHESITDLIRAIIVHKSGLKIISPRGLMAVSDRNKFVILQKDLKIPPLQITLTPRTYETDSGELLITKANSLKAQNKNILLLPSEKWNQTLIVRSWRSGDSIQLSSDGGSQKIQDVYTNQKLNYIEKITQPIVEMEGKIIWLPGIKNAHFEKLTSADCIQIEFISK